VFPFSATSGRSSTILPSTGVTSPINVFNTARIFVGPVSAATTVGQPADSATADAPTTKARRSIIFLPLPSAAPLMPSDMQPHVRCTGRSNRPQLDRQLRCACGSGLSLVRKHNVAGGGVLADRSYELIPGRAVRLVLLSRRNGRHKTDSQDGKCECAHAVHQLSLDGNDPLGIAEIAG
jgi:hypothetical protein